MDNPTYYNKFQQHYIALDCIIFGFNGEELKTIFIKRDFEPGYGEWALPGGFLRDYESLEMASNRILERLTGLKNVPMNQFFTFSEPARDPGARTVSVGFFALIRIEKIDSELVEKHNAFWKKRIDTPELMFDHTLILNSAIEALKKESTTIPIIFDLLPNEFTLPQLQMVFECVYQKKYDNRNFRKKILSLDILEKLDKKDKSTSRKGAFLYTFDRDKYTKDKNLWI